MQHLKCYDPVNRDFITEVDCIIMEATFLAGINGHGSISNEMH